MGDVIANIFDQILAETDNSAASHLARMVTIKRLAKQGLEARDAETTFATQKPPLAPVTPPNVAGVRPATPAATPAATPVVAKPNVAPKA